jgi:hypothetical protein
VLEKLPQPAMIQIGEELADIRVEHPVHPLPGSSLYQVGLVIE